MHTLNILAKSFVRGPRLDSPTRPALGGDVATLPSTISIYTIACHVGVVVGVGLGDSWAPNGALPTVYATV